MNLKSIIKEIKKSLIPATMDEVDNNGKNGIILRLEKILEYTSSQSYIEDKDGNKIDPENIVSLLFSGNESNISDEAQA